MERLSLFRRGRLTRSGHRRFSELGDFSLILCNLLFQIGGGLRLDADLGDPNRVLDSGGVIPQDGVVLKHFRYGLVERTVGILEFGIALNLFQQIFIPCRL